MRPCVFLDRDDTLIVNRTITAASRHPGSLYDPALVRLTPGAGEACAALQRAGYALVVVTNQGCVARGECTLEQMQATNLRLREVLRAASGVDLDGLYVCPYHPKGTAPPWNVEHPWRKPAPGMILAAAADLKLDLSRSWMIGDTERDIEAAIGAGIGVERTIIVGEEACARARHRAAGMVEAARIVLGGATILA